MNDFKDVWHHNSLKLYDGIVVVDDVIWQTSRHSSSNINNQPFVPMKDCVVSCAKFACEAFNINFTYFVSY